MLGLTTRSTLDARRPIAGYQVPSDSRGIGGLLTSWRQSRLMYDPGPVPAGGVGWTGDVVPWSVGIMDAEAALGIGVAYQCHALVTDSVGMLPTYARRVAGDGVSERTFPTPDVLRDPFPLISAMNWRSQATSSLLWWGNFYAIPFDADSNGYPRQLAPLHPDMVDVRLTSAGLPEYRMVETGRVFSANEFLHVRGHVLPGQPVGFGILDVAAGSLRSATRQRDYVSSVFSSGVPSGIIRVERPDMAEEEANRIKAKWMATFDGPGREPVVMPNSMDFEAISMNPVDADMASLRRLTARDICHFFGVHPGLIGEDSGSSDTYSNVESQWTGLLRYSIQPWTTRLQESLASVLPRGVEVRFDFDELLQPTTSERFDAWAAAISSGILTVDEVRERENLPPLAGTEVPQPSAPEVLDV